MLSRVVYVFRCVLLQLDRSLLIPKMATKRPFFFPLYREFANRRRRRTRNEKRNFTRKSKDLSPNLPSSIGLPWRQEKNAKIKAVSEKCQHEVEKRLFASRAAQNFHYLAVSRKNRKSLASLRARFGIKKLQFISFSNLPKFFTSFLSTTDV